MRTIFYFLLISTLSCSSIIQPVQVEQVENDKTDLEIVKTNVVEKIEYRQDESTIEESPCGLTCCHLEIACVEKKEDIMCRRITCSKCNKPSYTGCGRHVDQVLGDVPAADRCACKDDECEIVEAKCNNCPSGKKE